MKNFMNVSEFHKDMQTMASQREKIIEAAVVAWRINLPVPR